MDIQDTHTHTRSPQIALVIRYIKNNRNIKELLSLLSLKETTKGVEKKLHLTILQNLQVPLYKLVGIATSEVLAQHWLR